MNKVIIIMIIQVFALGVCSSVHAFQNNGESIAPKIGASALKTPSNLRPNLDSSIVDQIDGIQIASIQKTIAEDGALFIISKPMNGEYNKTQSSKVAPEPFILLLFGFGIIVLSIITKRYVYGNQS